MNKIKLVSDSSCDLTKEEINELNLDIVPFSVSFDDTNYFRENIDITLDEFYEKLSTPDVFAKTSLPSVNLYLDVFEKAVKDGLDVLCLTLSSKLSGSYQSAVNAKNILLEDYPDAKIEIIDSMQASIAQGALVLFAHKLIKSGKTLLETTEILSKNRENVSFYLTVNTLKYLQKGGRIGKTQALAGELLNVHPIISIQDGELIPATKVRGQKKAASTLIKLANEFVKSKLTRWQQLISV